MYMIKQKKISLRTLKVPGLLIIIIIKVALYSFFGARGMDTNGASARVFKEKKNNKNKHGGETFIASRVPLTAILFVPNKRSSKNA